MDDILKQATIALPLFSINIFPDLFKGMLKGIIFALSIQFKAVYVHLVCHWMIFPSLIYVLSFRYEWGLLGIWSAKVCLEFSIVTGYTYIIGSTNWQEASDKVKLRNQNKK